MAGEVNTTWFGDEVFFNKDGMPHVGFIISHSDDYANVADIVYYLPKSQRKPGDDAWVEAYGVNMGNADGEFQKK